MKKMIQWMMAAILICGTTMVFTSCSSQEDNPSSGQGDVVVAPAQLKQGVWLEYDSVLVASGKYTEEELAQMPGVGMVIEGDKASFFIYTAEDASEPVEGQINYNKTTGKGIITFPAIKDNPLSGQTVNFSAITDDVMEFELTYEGQTVTATFAWLCENLDNWNIEITDEDWKELMAYYQTISEDWGPDASIDWSSPAVVEGIDEEGNPKSFTVEGLDKPLVWNEEAAPVRTRFAITTTVVTMGLKVLTSLFTPDKTEETNAKLDAITGKVDAVLKNQQEMLKQLNDINNRLTAVATTMKVQATIDIFNERNKTYYYPLEVQNTKYFDSAYQLYVDNKDDLSKVSTKLGQYAKKWVGKNEENANLTWQYIKYLTNVQHSTYGMGMDKIYDGMTFEKYPWEHMGTGDRLCYRANDLLMITKCLFMISLYSTYCDLDDIDKEGLYKSYNEYKPQLLAFCTFNVADPDQFLVCQIPGAHFVMYKELQKYNYCGKDNLAPNPQMQYGGLDAVYRPEWHEAGSVKIDNPKSVKDKLIRNDEAIAIHRYYESESLYNNEYIWWYDILVDGNKMPAGAVYSKKPSGVKPCLLLSYPDRPHQTGLMWNGLQTIEIRPLWIRWRSGEPEQMGILREMGILPREIHWHNYYSEKEYYAAIVEERY